jgi:hypothetical protein
MVHVRTLTHPLAKIVAAGSGALTLTHAPLAAACLLVAVLVTGGLALIAALSTLETRRKAAYRVLTLMLDATARAQRGTRATTQPMPPATTLSTRSPGPPARTAEDGLM